MAKITILGAGITGLSIATILIQQQSRDRSRSRPPHTITILARDLPGDEPSQRWASPWACAGWGHDVLINASGIASATLEDVKDSQLIVDRTHVVLVKSKFDGGYVHRGPGPYTYIFGRGDGTAVVGGVSEMPQNGPTPESQIHQDLFRRAFEHLPQHFPSPDPANYEIIEHLEGPPALRPATGVRVERVEINGQKIIHAYGTTIGGYILSFGLGLEVARLLEEDEMKMDVPN
ncbi:hypothetical protein NEMBOFW57_008048 [Staphylotrichum longicolle]|uniref:FAD dependent oxidoreductase domain-containing protein n=1 Tax=Staphylotrichum longicolle TaxID=669026 RepID=A0AAD4HTW3_9PEZI|nr:hypothetical protein NEMBOFW57_008048 [Staphylotrichum longicolle]